MFYYLTSRNRISNLFIHLFIVIVLLLLLLTNRTIQQDDTNTRIVEVDFLYKSKAVLYCFEYDYDLNSIDDSYINNNREDLLWSNVTFYKTTIKSSNLSSIDNITFSQIQSDDNKYIINSTMNKLTINSLSKKQK